MPTVVDNSGQVVGSYKVVEYVDGSFDLVVEDSPASAIAGSARVSLRSVLQPVQDVAGNAISDGQVQINVRGGGSATVYADNISQVVLRQPLATVRGRVDGWVDEGSYEAVTSWKGQTQTDAFEVWHGASVAAAARKPPSNADAFGIQFQYVAEKGGSDTADGLSWGSPKRTITAAIAATPQGGRILVAPGSYAPSGPLVLNGHWIECVVRGSGGFNAAATLTHTFNGDFITMAKGGGLRNLVLSQGGNFTGDAVKCVSTGSPRGGSIWIENLTVTGGSNGFTRDLHLDGSADSTPGGPGIRQVFVKDSMFFGCKTAGETVVVNRGVHVYFSNCEIIQAPETGVTQGLKIKDNQSEAVQWNGGQILGDYLTEAQGHGVWVDADITGNATFAATSANGWIRGKVGGTVTNSGASTNRGPDAHRTFALQSDLPAASSRPGMVALVLGNSSGSRFQGSDGTSWVALG